jgi:nitric oxide reductase activation protein
LLPLAPTPRSQKQAEAEEKAKAKAKVKDKDKDKDKDNEEEEEEEDNEEEEVTNLLPTTANTANISHPLSGSTTAKEEAAEVDAVALTLLVMRATARTPATTALTLATPAPARWAIRSTRTSTTEGLRETRPGKWDPHSHFPGRWQHCQQQQQ